uniref:ATP-binding protein n=1 Tax=Bosea sp. NBC_00436 TaxID=2969620 RepID=A0A9E8CLI5_9HYPH
MSFTFAPAETFTERAGLFVSLTGGTNSGKTFSALRLARGIAGPNGKIAILDTEGGRTLHLKDEFRFDANVMDPPFRPERFAEAAKSAEDAGYAALVIDSFSMEWVGIGGVLDWQAQEIQRMAGDDYRKQERMKMASWIKPKGAHKAMVYSLLQRRIPIIFSIRGEESVKPGANPGDKPTKLFKSVTNSQFPYEVTVSFRLETERKGYLDLSDPKSFKLEGSHEALFKHGDRISEEHGAALAAWAMGARDAVKREPPRPPANAADDFPGDASDPVERLIDDARTAAMNGLDAYQKFFGTLSREDKALLSDRGEHAKNKDAAARVDQPPEYGADADEPRSAGRG